MATPRGSNSRGRADDQCQDRENARAYRANQSTRARGRSDRVAAFRDDLLHLLRSPYGTEPAGRPQRQLPVGKSGRDMLRMSISGRDPVRTLRLGRKPGPPFVLKVPEYAMQCRDQQALFWH